MACNAWICFTRARFTSTFARGFCLQAGRRGGSGQTLESPIANESQRRVHKRPEPEGGSGRAFLKAAAGALVSGCDSGTTLQSLYCPVACKTVGSAKLVGGLSLCRFVIMLGQNRVQYGGERGQLVVAATVAGRYAALSYRDCVPAENYW